MLVLGRSRGEVIWIGDDIQVMICEIIDQRVTVGVEAPIGIAIHREEVYQKLQRQRGDAGLNSAVRNEWHCWPENRREMLKVIHGEALTPLCAAVLAADFFDKRIERTNNGMPPKFRTITVSDGRDRLETVELEKELKPCWIAKRKAGAL